MKKLKTYSIFARNSYYEGDARKVVSNQISHVAASKDALAFHNFGRFIGCRAVRRFWQKAKSLSFRRKSAKNLVAENYRSLFEPTDFIASGGDGGGGIGTLLLLNLFRDQVQKNNTPNPAPGVVPTNGGGKN